MARKNTTRQKKAYPQKRQKSEAVREQGPRKWLFPDLESAYTRLIPREEAPAEKLRAGRAEARRAAKKARPRGKKAGVFQSRLQPGRGEEVMERVAPTFWTNRLAEYKRRKVLGGPPRVAPRIAMEAVMPGMPAIPGQNNWLPLGPSIVARGQAAGRPAVGGRVSGIAIAPGGARVYAATANGGVFRSDDSGASWKSCMDGFDLDPTSFASTSLCCGAIAIDLNDPNRVYVGTGEGDTNALFGSRLTNALPAYRGIGPIRSDDGGGAWATEPVAAGSPALAGAAFFALAVDPANREHVVAATTVGLYERLPAAGGGFEWTQRRTGIHPSVVVARTGSTTTFYAAAWGDKVYQSTDGATWTAAGTAFPAGVGRIALGLLRDNPNVLYALVATTAGQLQGIYRLDGGAGAWKLVSGAPAALLTGSQGDYDLTIAIDPNNANRVYIGGDTQLASGQWSSSIYRCDVSPSGSAYSMVPTYIGANVHSDVHVVTLPPADSNTLWVACDGGAFFSQNVTGAATFVPRNTGLSCLCTNYVGLHPTEPAVIFCGLQDNGTARYVGEESWRHVQGGDGGYCIVNWADPFKVLVYANGRIYRATDGGQDYSSWSVFTFPWLLMAEPTVSPPPNPGNPAEADIVAIGVGGNIRISTDFAQTFPTTVALPAGSGSIYSMVFANATRLFVGTTAGRVFRVDNAGGAWTATRIDNLGSPLGLVGLVSDIAVDWSDAGRNSVFIAFGGSGDFRHVWRFDGANWQARSGTAGSGSELLDVEHNAIVVDPDNAGHVYVGADIGVWSSTDAGVTWAPLSNGLPDAPVFDLQIHRASRLLRASTHGRGLFEYKLDPPAQADVDLYVRDTMLDTGRGVNTDGRNDPSRWPTQPVWHWNSANIKVDAPTPLGYQTPTNQIDFFQFNEVIVDGSQGVETIAPPLIVHNRVYVEVHNRGRVDAASVRVMTAITNASTVLNPLPAGYEVNVQTGTPFSDPNWVTIGITTLTNLRAGFPQIAAFDLTSNLLPLPASLPGQSHYCLVAFLHSTQDPYTSTQHNVDLLTVQDRKVGQKNLHILEFIGTPPPPGKGLGMWARLDINGFLFKERGLIDLVFDARRFPGTIQFVAPERLMKSQSLKDQRDFVVGSNKLVKQWYQEFGKRAERLYWEGKYSKENFRSLLEAMKLVAGQPLLRAQGKEGLSIVHRVAINPQDRHTIFLRIDPPAGAKIGSAYEFSIVQRDARSGQVQGGASYRVVINRPAKK